MAAHTQRILISQPVYLISCRVIPTTIPIFLRLKNSNRLFRHCVMQVEVKNSKWRLTNRDTYISTCLPRSSIIPTTIPVFLRLGNSTELFPTLSDVSGSEKNPRWRLITKNTYISTIISRSCMNPTTISTFLRLRNSTELFSISFDSCGSEKSKMAVHKRNTYLSTCIYHVAA